MPEKRALSKCLDSVSGESSTEQQQQDQHRQLQHPQDEKRLKVADDPCGTSTSSSITVPTLRDIDTPKMDLTAAPTMAAHNSSSSAYPPSYDLQRRRPQQQLHVGEMSHQTQPSDTQQATSSQLVLGSMCSGVSETGPKACSSAGDSSHPYNPTSIKNESDSTLTSSDLSEETKKMNPPKTTVAAPLHSVTNNNIPENTVADCGKEGSSTIDVGRCDPVGISAPSSSSPPLTSGMGSKKLSPPPPLKSTKMRHLLKKYMPQLEYMHREFKKLERQLLGAKTSAKGFTESTGSRERREKLHSFIVHLEETMNQIHAGCEMEQGAKICENRGDTSVASRSGNTSAEASLHSSSETGSCQQASALDQEESKREFARASALTKLTKEKEEEENVQKLEEHILANLLPVKERLMKQLAAQQGAVKNPIGMPNRRGLQPPSATAVGRDKTVANGDGNNVVPRQGITSSNATTTGPITGPTAVSQFGKPLKGGGSSLTQKLHGKTLGSQKYVQGQKLAAEQGVLNTSVPGPSAQRKVVYAGMTPGSGQVQSGVSAATGVHNMIIETSRHRLAIAEAFGKESGSKPPPPPPPPPPNPPAHSTTIGLNASGPQSSLPKNPLHVAVSETKDATPRIQASHMQSHSIAQSTRSAEPGAVRQSVVEKKKEMKHEETINTDTVSKIENQRLEVAKQRQLNVQQQETLNVPQKKGKPSVGLRVISNPKKGPRSVEYICALCNETYKATCEYNPWWALSSHECMKCGKTQIPRLDIASPANAIDYHPALLVHATTEETVKGAPKTVAVSSVPNQVLNTSQEAQDHDTECDGSILDNNDDKDGFDSDSDDSEMDQNTPAAQALNEDFGKNYTGPKFNEYDASRLLILMSHASTCPGRHKVDKHRDCCTNIKFMMLHVRDCTGTTPSNDICPFPWCRKTKHLLYHLVSCPLAMECKICAPVELSRNLKALKGLNEYRFQKLKDLYREHSGALTISSNASESHTPTNSQTAFPSIKKSNPHRKMSRNVVVGSTSHPIVRNTKVHHPPQSVMPQHNSTDDSAISVPSPIPTIGLSSSKPNNPLSHGQPQTAKEKNYHPAARAKASSQPLKISVPKELMSTNKSLSQGLGNPLTILNTPSTYAASKISSPPNPLKGLATDHIAAPGTNFPMLPTQISINDDSENTATKGCHNSMRKVKVEVDR